MKIHSRYYEFSVHLSNYQFARNRIIIFDFLGSRGFPRNTVCETTFKKNTKIQVYCKTSAQVKKLKLAFQKLSLKFPYESKQLNLADWRDKWLKYFRSCNLGSRFFLKSQDNHRPFKHNRRRILLTLNAKGAFGSGTHPSTRLAIELMEKVNINGSFLDIGTGTGILAICAFKLGAIPVTAVENDTASIHSAAHNFALNHCRCRLLKKPFESVRIKERYQTVAANLISLHLESIQHMLSRIVRPGGHLIVSGIHDSNACQFLKRFKPNKLRLIHSRHSRRWAAFIFKKSK